MKRFITFGSIEQFSTVVKNVKRGVGYLGQDDNDEAMFDRTAKAPKLVATYSEKIHGTNASVCYSNPDGFWIQSRKNIITTEKDNSGCAFVQEANKSEWMNIIDLLAKEYNINLDEKIISVYFEWAGGNIQKKSALSGLDKRAVIFQYFKVSPIEPILAKDGSEESAIWLETKLADSANPQISGYDEWVDCPEKNIFNIMNFPHGTIEIDFERPDLAQNVMIKMVEDNEKNSPVGQQFGIEKNILEGYVFATVDEQNSILRWKVKGEEHSKGSGKIRKLKPVDSAREQKKIDFVNNFACTESRLQQMWQEIVNGTHNGDENQMTMKYMGQFLSLIFKDVIKEESDKMAEQGFEPKELNGNISKVARGFFQSKVDEVAFL